MALDDYKTALVTGASSGIGAAVVTALSARGLAVTAAARRAARLEALAEETGCTPLVVDLRDTGALYDALGGLEVDILGQHLEQRLHATAETGIVDQDIEIEPPEGIVERPGIAQVDH